MSDLKKIIGQTFMDLAEGLETGSFGKKPRIALTGLGSEHGEENAMAAAVAASRRGVDVLYIGTLEAEGVTTVYASDDEEGHRKMDELLSEGRADGAVTMHYPFPIGVSTVGRAVTPAKGREMYIANTTGTSSGDRIEGMILNAVDGIITAKTMGISDPTVGILNVDGARQTEMALNRLRENGFSFRWAVSGRADGGAVLRGNDVLQGTPDVLVTDSLTGNVLIKMLSAYTTGGSFESVGYGYGPGIGRNYDRLVLIISRASGAPLITNALLFAADLVRGKVFEKAAEEFARADAAGLQELLRERKESGSKKEEKEEEIVCPPAEPCTASIAGIEVMDLEDAAKVLWKNGIYAETGMGCTGPLVMMSEANHEKAAELLRAAGYIG